MGNLLGPNIDYFLETTELTNINSAEDTFNEYMKKFDAALEEATEKTKRKQEILSEYSKKLDGEDVKTWGRLRQQKLNDLSDDEAEINERLIKLEAEEKLRAEKDIAEKIYEINLKNIKTEAKEKAKAAKDAADIEMARLNSLTDGKTRQDIVRAKREEDRQKNLAKIREVAETRLAGLTESYNKKLQANGDKWDEKKKKKLEQHLQKEAEALQKRAEKEEEILNKRHTFAEKQQMFDNAGSGIGKILGGQGGKMSDEELLALKESFRSVAGAVGALASFADSLREQVDKIASFKSAVDTNLQGSSLGNSWDPFAQGGVWDNVSKQITGAAAISPFVTQESVAQNVQALAKSGIALNLAQRAFLNTVKDKVADTFNAADGTMLRIIKIQQKDSTAARLGMESSLTTFLNSMYETSEYMHGAVTQVRSSIADAMSLMDAEAAVGFEYNIQKWLGSLSSVGVSDGTIQGIASTIGQITSGRVEGVTSGGASNLMVMAANQAGLSIADILAKGLDDSSINNLLLAMSNYVKGLYDDSKDNLVVQQQIAQVFGMTAADLKAVANLYSDDSTLGNIYNSSSNYGQSMDQLKFMLDTMGNRTSNGEKFKNAFSNLSYTLSAGIANNPVLYAIYSVAGMAKDVFGGVNIPAISAFGTGIDLETNIADLMQVAALSGSVISGIANVISAGGGGGITGGLLAKGFGIDFGSGATAVKRGNLGNGKITLTQGGSGLSESGTIGNSNSGDIQQATLDNANKDANKQLQTAKDENEEATTTDINNTLIDTLNLLKSIANGQASFHVQVDKYGLTGWN